MTLPWEERSGGDVPKYIIIDCDGFTVLGVAETEDEVLKTAMRETTINKKNIEVYKTTGFGSWKKSMR